ncbi:MAG: hypothetical protein LBO71_01530 [Prevotellaceae bacterium]|nr:hypothetical protein [Prevotellaceae bacterium]
MDIKPQTLACGFLLQKRVPKRFFANFGFDFNKQKLDLIILITAINTVYLAYKMSIVVLYQFFFGIFATLLQVMTLLGEDTVLIH